MRLAMGMTTLSCLTRPPFITDLQRLDALNCAGRETGSLQPGGRGLRFVPTAWWWCGLGTLFDFPVPQFPWIKTSSITYLTVLT